jgi:hypothetical protein
MSDTAALLRRAADACDDYVLSDKDHDAIQLMAHHILHRCGTEACEDEAKLLMRVLDR